MLLWADGFDHYGSDESNMLDGVYANTGTSDGSALATSPTPPTGTHCYLVSWHNNDGTMLRKVLPASKDKLGCAARFYFETLPTGGTGGPAIFEFCTYGTNTPHISIVVLSTGAIQVVKDRNYFSITSGSEGTAIATSDPLIVAGAWNHVEAQIYKHATTGWVRIAVNGVHRFEATGLDTSAATENIVGVAWTSGKGGSDPYYMDDLYIYDFTGDSSVFTDWCPTVDGGTGVATNYMGEWQVMLRMPEGDTAEADWAKSSGTTGHTLIGETDPNDATRISSTAAGDLSEFAIQDLPEDITVIRGVMAFGRQSKSDSGIAMTRMGMKSVAAVEDAAERPITVEPTYWWDFINEDPNSPGNRWTRASFNAAWLRLTRSV